MYQVVQSPALTLVDTHYHFDLLFSYYYLLEPVIRNYLLIYVSDEMVLAFKYVRFCPCLKFEMKSVFLYLYNIYVLCLKHNIAAY